MTDPTPEAADALAERDARITRLEQRITEYRQSRKRWIEAAFRDRAASVALDAKLRRILELCEEYPAGIDTALILEAAYAEPAGAGEPRPGSGPSME